jgi:ATP-dependent phosphofructokinase / diphosphate-dependent phosphofructokinase
MRLGILTGGGDCPGLNAAIRAVVRHAHARYGSDVLGFRDGWQGVLRDQAQALTPEDVRGLLPRGGTILGTSGVQPFREAGGVDRVRETMARHALDGFVVVGGEGTMGACAKMPDVPVVGIPKTIDNDIDGTDFSIGFHSAVQIATDLIDRLFSTAESHHRVMVCEVMGRSAGWIGLTSGLAGNADVILIPERPFDMADVARRLQRIHTDHRAFSIVVVSEGAVPLAGTMDVPDYPLDPNGWPRLGGMGSLVAAEIEARTGYETRITVLGHVQRGGSPVAADRVLATLLGEAAVDRAARGEWGCLIGRRGEQIVTTSLAEVGGAPRVVPEARWRIPQVLCE